MEYFINKYDIGIEKPKVNISEEEFNSKNPIVKETSFDNYFCDFIAYNQIKNSYYVVSDELKKVYEMYTPNIEAIALVFSNAKEGKQKLHWIIKPEVIDCISEMTSYSLDGMVKNLVLSKKDIEGKHIFLVKAKYQTLLITSLDMAESILRRGLTGVKFIEVKQEG